ncbi:hypothetical protein vseg_003246 [Gypsophila vaccaria]
MAKSAPEILIPSLPNEVASLILAYTPLCHHTRLKQTSKAWDHFFTHSQPLIHSLRLHSNTLSPILVIFPSDPSLSHPFLFDPTHLGWAPLPLTPVNPHSYSLSFFSALSCGPHLYLLGGSLFDSRSFPLDRPSPSSSVFRFDFTHPHLAWSPLSPMITPRGSFASALVPGGIVVAGGGSRHPFFGAAGTRLKRVERYDVHMDEWVDMDDLPGYRAGCIGFTVGDDELWVMGGYGGRRTIAGVLPVDDHCMDVVVMGLPHGRWRELGDMTGLGERRRLGKLVVLRDAAFTPFVFMLDEDSHVSRFNMASNSWSKETTVPKKNQDGSSYGFVAIGGELYVMSLLAGVELAEVRRSRHRKRGTFLLMQIYNPKTKSWRSLVTRTPFQCPLDFKTAVMCTICL